MYPKDDNFGESHNHHGNHYNERVMSFLTEMGVPNKKKKAKKGKRDNSSKPRFQIKFPKEDL